mgnify:CR=1 FL=1
MGYIEIKHDQARSLLGKRIEIPVHYNMWMHGARTGKVSSVGPDGKFVRVHMDHPQVKRRVHVWRIDFDYIKRL